MDENKADTFSKKFVCEQFNRRPESALVYIKIGNQEYPILNIFYYEEKNKFVLEGKKPRKLQRKSLFEQGERVKLSVLGEFRREDLKAVKTGIVVRVSNKDGVIIVRRDGFKGEHNYPEEYWEKE